VSKCLHGCNCGRHSGLKLSDKPNWKGDQAGYAARHDRVKTVRGKASNHPCVTCGKPARDWAEIHGTGGFKFDDYQPMCRVCHREYDSIMWDGNQGLNKLTRDDVIDIRKSLQLGLMNGNELARKYNVTNATISSIRLGKSWSWLKENDNE
jgi:hypothetical protein